MDQTFQQETFSRLLVECQALLKELDAGLPEVREDRARVLAVQSRLEQAKAQLFAGDSASRRDADGRKKVRDGLRGRVQAVKARLESLKSQVEVAR